MKTDIDEQSRDLGEFGKRVLEPHLKGQADLTQLPDALMARSLIPPLTAKARSFAGVAPELPEFSAASCVACMECVMSCPDASIVPRVTPAKDRDEAVSKVKDDGTAAYINAHFAKTTKFWDIYEKKNQTPAFFSLWVDPDKCKGCGECVNVCGDHKALCLKPKNDRSVTLAAVASEFASNILPPTPKEYLNERLLVDLFLADDTWVYKGGAGACKGCGEITALKMALTATASKYGSDMIIVASTGCNSVFSSTYPFNIFSVPWTNPLFENAPAMALGAKLRLNQTGRRDTKVLVVGGDGAMSDIGFQSLSRILTSGEDLNVLVLDTQVYSNTGGQSSSATFVGQNAKMSAAGKASQGKTERRKELALLAMMHPDVYVAQVSPAYYNHFLRAVLGALEYKGPSVMVAYSPCMPEHGIGDDAAFERSKAAVISRAFPLFVHDPRKGPSLKDRLDLKGNPSLNNDWHRDQKTNALFDFTWFARNEERFAQLFDAAGAPTEALLKSQDDRLKNWNLLRELAGIKLGSQSTTVV